MKKTKCLWICTGLLFMLAIANTSAIQLKDIYYSSKHPELNITLEISVDKLNRKKYKIVIENFDPGEEESNGPAVTRLVEIANERWNLGLTCGNGANEPS